MPVVPTCHPRPRPRRGLARFCPIPWVAVVGTALAAAALTTTVVTASCSKETSSPPASRQAELVAVGAGLMGPMGTVATVDATGLAKVAALATDPEGRLWAATAEFEDKGTDAVYLVPAKGATPVKIIEEIHTPLGLLWIGDTLFVSSKERVDAFSAFDGNVFGGHRVVLELPEGVGEVNGMALAPNGRIMLGISAPCDSCAPPSEWSSSVVSFVPDGSNLGSDLRTEAKGIRAPIGLTYYPGTEDLFVTMNHRDDLDPNTPGDWLSVVRSGQSWGFPGCYGQGGGACAGTPQPVVALDPHAAASGVAIVTGQLGPDVGNAAIVAEWAQRKVQKVSLERTEGGYRGSVSPFVTGIDRPVPVVLSGGDVLIGDWGSGTVYRISREQPGATTSR